MLFLILKCLSSVAWLQPEALARWLMCVQYVKELIGGE